MKIPAHQIHNILKIYKTSKRDPQSEKTGNDSKWNNEKIADVKSTSKTDQVKISENGRKEQIKREILSEIVKKIR